MMKTITEYQPLIYAQLFAEPVRRRTRRQHVLPYVSLGIYGAYFVAILLIMAETACTPLNWQFWVMFLPILALGEKLHHSFIAGCKASVRPR